MNSHKSSISVIMPSFNVELYIARAIESILAQTFSDFEFIIIDDGSTDDTLSIIEEYQKKDRRIHIIQNKENLRIAASLNKGVGSVSAEYIVRMDADDISLPNRIEQLYAFLRENSNVAVVGSNIVIVDERGRVISKREYPKESRELKKVMFRYSPFAHPAVMFRKKAFLEFGGYDLKNVPCEDIDLWFKIGSKYEFATIPQFLLQYTILPTSSSHTKLRTLELLGFRLKINAIRTYGYRPTFYDIVYNIAEFITLWFMPTNVRVWVYNFLRSRNLI